MSIPCPVLMAPGRPMVPSICPHSWIFKAQIQTREGQVLMWSSPVRLLAPSIVNTTVLNASLFLSSPHPTEPSCHKNPSSNSPTQLPSLRHSPKTTPSVPIQHGDTPLWTTVDPGHRQLEPLLKYTNIQQTTPRRGLVLPPQPSSGKCISPTHSLLLLMAL